MILFINISMKADHNTGADITYKLINPATGQYKFTVTLYRDCAGILFASEMLYVRTNTVSTSIPLTLIGTSEITPVCQVPDVATPIVTNCPSGAIVNNIRGYNKYVYEATYTIGVNKGMAYVGWTNCCRSSIINTGGANDSYWVQAVINTNFTNNSVLLKNEPSPIWCSGKLSTYNMGAEDIYDPKYISINGQNIIRDSLVYEFYTPSNAEAANASNAINLQNPGIIFNPTLNSSNFLYTTNGVSLDQSNGNITCTPSQEQDAVLAMAVKEYRAIPNSSGQGYTRQLVGYICRDMNLRVTSSCNAFTYNGVVEADSIIDNKTITTCKTNNIQFKLKFVGSPNQPLKLFDNSTIDATSIANYTVSKTINTANTVDTMYVNVRFDKIKNINKYTFLYKAYYCLSNGYKVCNYYPITIHLRSGGNGFSQDTISYCVGTPSVRLNLPFAKNTNWSQNTNIVKIDSIDSSWVDVNPSRSIWYYANNIGSTNSCLFSDSIFVKVDTCFTVSGYLFSDLNSDCIKSSLEPIFPNILLDINATNGSYSKQVYTDNTGYYSFSPPANSTFDIKSQDFFFNCSTQPKTYNVIMGNSNKLADIPVKDSALVSNVIPYFIDISQCVYDSISFSVDFIKTYGTLKSIVYFGNGDSTIKTYSKSAGTYSHIVSYLYKKAGTNPIRIAFINSNNKKDTSYLVNNFTTYSCLNARLIFDLDTNCNYSSTQDAILVNQRVNVLDSNINSTSVQYTNGLGEINLRYNPSHLYKFTFQSYTTCPITSKIAYLAPVNVDTNLQKDFFINPYIYNFIPSISLSGKINNIDTVTAHISVNGSNSIQKTFEFIIPSKCKIDTVLNVSSYNRVNNILYFTSSSRYIKIKMDFDSLVSTDTLCFTLKMNKVLNEFDTIDNITSICRRAFTSCDPNDKLSSIHSMLKNEDFTNKFDPINYTINFQNIGDERAKDVYIDDILSSKLDLNTLTIINSSHPMTTTLDDTRKLRFEFKNILLPSKKTDEEASKGFVTFNINPDTSLNFNDIISNNASIKFDFNDTINTNWIHNKYVEIIIDTVKVIDTSKKDSTHNSIRYLEKDEITVYPNPVSDYLNIKIKDVSVDYNVKLNTIDGKLLFESNNSSKINMSKLSKGLYLLIISTEKYTKQFIVQKE